MIRPSQETECAEGSFPEKEERVRKKGGELQVWEKTKFPFMPISQLGVESQNIPVVGSASV
jgi:hypothetical protein